LLTAQLSEEPNEWECLVRPGRKIGIGEKLHFREHSPETGHPTDSADLQAEVTARGSFGERRIRVHSPLAIFFARGRTARPRALPPLNRSQGFAVDRQRYQTVYARTRGSVARTYRRIALYSRDPRPYSRSRHCDCLKITLHVGLGTFSAGTRPKTLRIINYIENRLRFPRKRPIRSTRAKADGRRVVAVGTTTVRTLEFAARLASAACASTIGVKTDSRNNEGWQSRHSVHHPAHVEPGRRRGRYLYLSGYRFRIVDALLTNFHLPQSTLLMLVCALGRARTGAASLSSMGSSPAIASTRMAIACSSSDSCEQFLLRYSDRLILSLRHSESKSPHPTKKRLRQSVARTVYSIIC